MFCSNCGSKVEEGNLFCTSCGAKVEGAAAPVQAPKYEEFVLGSTEEVPAKKKKKAPKWVLPAAIAGVLAVVVAVVCIFLFGNSSANLSGQDHLKKVETEALNGYVDSLTQLYGNFIGNVSNGQSMPAGSGDINVSVRLGDDLKDILEMYTGGEIDLSWLNEIAMKMKTDTYEDLQKLDVELLLSNKEIIVVSAVLDWAEECLYLGVPNLNDTYLEMDLDALGVMDQMEEYLGTMQSMMAYDGDLPDAATVNALLDKYVGVILNNLPKVDKESDKVSLGGLEQKCYVLTLEINQQDLMKIAKALLETAKDDDQLLDVIESFSDYYNEMMEAQMDNYGYGYGWTYVDFAEEFEDAVDYALEMFEDIDIDDLDDDTLFELVTYVDNKDNIIGQTLEIDAADVELSYLTVTEGKDFRFEAMLGMVEIEGKGTVSNNILNGEYVLSVDGDEYLEVNVQNFDQKKWENGELVGKFILTPTEDMMDQLDTYIGADLSLSLDVNMTNTTAMMDVEVMIDGLMMVGVKMEVTSREGQKVTIPSNTVSGMDQEDLMDWVLDFDFDKIIDNLDAAGIPNEYLDMLEDVLDQVG